LVHPLLLPLRVSSSLVVHFVSAAQLRPFCRESTPSSSRRRGRCCFLVLCPVEAALLLLVLCTVHAALLLLLLRPVDAALLLSWSRRCFFFFGGAPWQTKVSLKFETLLFIIYLFFAGSVYVL
jgi:hypothetical protein